MTGVILTGIFLALSVAAAAWIIGTAPDTFDEDEPEEDQL